MTLSHTMRAIEISEPGGPDVLQPVDLPVPVPGHGQIVIRVAYAGVNRPDVLQRMGSYAPPPSASPLPGLEASGHVVALGPGVERWAIGDAVCALLPGGGYAEYVATPAAHALPVPDGLSLRVTDDGTGFDPDRLHDGFGLLGMRERAERIGATLHVSSAAGRGTRVLMHLASPGGER